MKASQIIQVNGSIKGVNITGEAIIYKAFKSYDEPKTWRKVGTIGHNLGSLYNPSWMEIFKARDGSFRYGIYRDGSIAEFYGKIVFLENTGTAVQPRNIPGFKNELIEGY